MTTASHRVLISQGPFSPAQPSDAPPWEDRGWVCRWVAPEGGVQTPAVYVYRCVFEIEAAATVRLHVTADERYALFLDGKPLGVGPERGDPDHWFFETYDLPLTPGRHVLAARVWSLGGLAPWAQRTVRHGLLLAPKSMEHVDLIGTGVAGWECKRQDGIAFHNPSAEMGTAAGVGPAETIDAASYPWGIEYGDGLGWQCAVAGERGNDGFTLYPFRPAHRLYPAVLPPMFDVPIGALRIARSGGAVVDWSDFVTGGQVTVPPYSTATALVELPTYACFYPSVSVSGGAGATVRWTIAEAPTPKDDRRVIDGKTFRGLNDTLIVDGGSHRYLAPLWWRCGRWVEITVNTASGAVQLSDFVLQETRYPLPLIAPTEIDDPAMAKLLQICKRTVETCCHETYMDCPYYEQLMYVGDARLQCLTTYVISPDPRPAIKALAMIESSRSNFNHLPIDAAPGDSKFIPTFALQWIAMVHEFALYHDRPEIARAMLPAVRAILDRFFQHLSGGVLRSPAGWNFIDWAAAPFKFGVPPGGEVGGLSATINLTLLIALDQASTLETYVGEPELASLYLRRAGELASHIEQHFFDRSIRFFRETRDSDVLTEHAQALAVLSGRFDEKIGEFARDDRLIRSGPYFTHFVIQALYQLADTDGVFLRLKPWLDLPREGLFTTPETFGATRSDCHAWTAHPLYHSLATFAGVRPAAYGGRHLAIRPMLGPIRHMTASLPTPSGDLRIEYEVGDESTEMLIDLPPGITAYVSTRGESIRLTGMPRRQTITLKNPTTLSWS